MFNHKKVDSLEKRVKKLEARVKELEERKDDFFGEDISIPWNLYPARGRWDKLLDYLGVEYWEDNEKRSGFRRKKRGSYKKRSKRGRSKKKTN